MSLETVLKIYTLYFAESEIQTKVGAERQTLQSVLDNIKAAGKEIEKLLDQTAQDTVTCFISLKCIADLSASVVPKISDISSDVVSEAAILQSLKDDVLPDLASFIASIDQSVESQALDIAQQIIECVNDKTSGADSTSTAQ